MKLFKNTSKGTRFQIIGYIVFFTCWIIPIILTDVLSLRGHEGLVFMLCQMGIGGFLILFGGAVNKREDSDPNYVIPKNFFRVFKARQLLLMAALVMFFGSVFGNMDGNEGWWTAALLIGMYVCLIAAAVVGIIQHKKNKKDFVSVGNGKMIRTSSPVSASIRCNGCNKLLNPNDLRAFEGKKYCSSCYMNAFAKKQIKDESGNSKPLQCHCSICNRVFPQSSFHIVNDKFICDECFQKEYSVNL